MQEEISFAILQTLVSFSEELNKRKQHTFWTKIKMSSFWARARQNFRDFATINKPEAPGHPGACNRSPGSKLLSITTQLHCGGHLGGRARLPDTILEEDHPMTIPSKFGSN